MTVKAHSFLQTQLSVRPPGFFRAFVLRALAKPLEALSFRVYTAFLPVSDEAASGARYYLTDLWTDAPLSGAVLHTVLATGLFLSPFVFFVAFKPLGFLGSTQQERWDLRLSRNSLYPVRLAYYAGRGHAFVAVLRETAARKEILTTGARP